MRRYIGLDLLARARMTVIDTEQATEEVPPTAITLESRTDHAAVITHHAGGRDHAPVAGGGPH